MKLFHKLAASLTLLLLIGLPYGCNQKNQHSGEPLLKAYQKAVEAQDYIAATSLLVQLASADSSKYSWAYDSLTLYHFVYLAGSGTVRNPVTPMYYTEQGLKINPENAFLLEMKAKLLLEEKKDTASFKILNDLWNKSHDYTYLWEMTLIELLRTRVAVVDSMTNQVLSAPDISSKKVRIVDQIRQNVNAKAAFLYIRATVYNIKGEFKKTAEDLQEALKIQPDFYLAQKGLYELQQNLNAGARR